MFFSTVGYLVMAVYLLIASVHGRGKKGYRQWVVGELAIIIFVIDTLVSAGAFCAGYFT